MNVIGIVQVRMGSSRLPGKAMAEVEGRPMTWHIVTRMRKADSLQNVVLALPDGPRDEPLRDLARAESIPYHTGSEADLIDRLYQTAEAFGGDAIVRITGDCPLADPTLIDRVVGAYAEGAPELDYVSNIRPPTYPHGLDTEVYPRHTLEKLWHDIEDPTFREWFPVYLWEREDQFRTYNVKYETDLSHLRWTVDYPEDLEFVREVYRRLYEEDQIFEMQDVLELLESHPELTRINAHRVGREIPLDRTPRGPSTEVTGGGPSP